MIKADAVSDYKAEKGFMISKPNKSNQRGSMKGRKVIARLEASQFDITSTVEGELPKSSPSHPHSVPIECLSKRRMLERTPISTSLMGNKPITKLIQMFQLTSVFSLLVVSQEMEMEVLQHNITMILGEGQTKLMLKRIGWNLKEKAKLMPPFMSVLS